MVTKKKAAESAEDANGGKRNTYNQNIAESGGEVKPSTWAEKEAQWEHEQNLKAFGDIRAGLLGRLPALYNGVEYRRVSGIIYRRHPNGGFRVQAELEDRCGHSSTIAAPRKVQVLGLEPEGPERPEKAEPPHVSKLSTVLKKALRTGVPVICDGQEYCSVAAIIYRLDEEAQGLKVLVELEGCGDHLITAVTPRAAEIHNPGTCDEMCGIEV